MINLGGNNLSSSFPKFFAKFSHLSSLDLGRCGLYGEIPQKILQFSNLVNLDLEYNSLEGSIPSSLFALPQLKSIYLSNNKFSGQLNMSPSAQLEEVDLSNNYLEGSFYLNDVIQHLGNLSFLDLSYNNFSIDVESSVSASYNFPTLYSINLASCRLNSFPKFLANLSKL